MRNYLFLPSITLLVLLASCLNLGAQDIDMVSSNNSPTNVLSICQCDTLGDSGPQGRPEVKYFLSAPFNPNTDFTYELAPAGNFANAVQLDLVQLTQPNQVMPVDSFATGTKWADLAVPCNFPTGNAQLRILNSNGEISDTLYYNVNKIPSKPKLDSIRYGYPNPYTTGVDDWGFCTGDSVVLYAETQFGATYQWNNNGTPISGIEATYDSLVVKNAGIYSVTVDLGACSRTSPDTIINDFLPPTAISLFQPGVAAIGIDNPSAGNTTPNDSIQFCENNNPILQANAPVAATGLTYEYQWLTDSVNSFNDTILYPAPGNDSIQNYQLPSGGRYYVAIYDGFCTDTSAAFHAFEDTIPDVDISNQVYSQGILLPANKDVEICMTDSVLLSTDLQITDSVEFQWQRLNTGLTPPQWVNVNRTNFDRRGNRYTLQVDTAIKPITPLSFYRLKLWTLTPFNRTRICSYTTDSVVIRWKPQDSIRIVNNSWVNVVNSRTANLCETDSVQLTAPTIPGQMVTYGYSMDYQWLKDTLDTASGNLYKKVLAGEDFQSFYTNESGDYYVATDDGICMDTLGPISVFVDTVPSTMLTETRYPGQTSVPDRELCLTDSVMLTAMDTVLPGWNYQWELSTGDGNWQTLANDTLPWNSVDVSDRPSNEDTLWFRIKTTYFNRFNLQTCDYTSDSISVQFYDPPTLSFFPSDSVGVCAGDSVLIIGQGNSLSYSWDGGAVLGPQRWISQPGTYQLTGTGVNGCTTTRSVQVYNLQTTANAGSNITAGSGETVTLNGSGGTNYRWYASQPINWSDFLSQSVDVSYNLPEGVTSDTITIYLEATNTAGCVDTDSLLFIVSSDADEDLALSSRAWNYFSPNGDGLNDVWDISDIVNEYNACSIDILNRWGATVYQDDDFQGVWNGDNNGGSPLPDGTYYYILSCDDEVLLKKPVTLIRNQ